jgi:pilus assembly protein CpaF
MGLVDRIQQHHNGNGSAATANLSLRTSRSPNAAGNDSFRELKLAVHNRLLETIDVSKLESLDPLMVSTKLTSAIGSILEEEDRLLTDADRTRLVEEIKNEMLGLGPLEPLLWDDEISDILVNGHSQVYIEKHGKLEKTDIVFQDDQHLLRIIERIVSRVGRRVDESSPMW